MYTIDSLLAGDFRTFGSALSHLILPACVLGWTMIGSSRAWCAPSMLDVLGQDYVLTARAKGASETRVLLNHALRNAMIPALTIIGFSFAYLITGAILTETIFSWPGSGLTPSPRHARSTIPRSSASPSSAARPSCSPIC